MKEQTDKKVRQYVTEQQAEHMLKMKDKHSQWQACSCSGQDR